MEDKKTLYSLTDIVVKTLGLVHRGAVGETFLLIKNEDGTMPDDIQLNDENQEEIGKSLLEQIGANSLMNWFKGAIEKATQSQLDEIEQDLSKAKSKKAMNGNGGSSGGMDEEEMPEDEMEDDEEMMMDDKTKKSKVKKDDNMTVENEVTKEVEVIQKSDVQSLIEKALSDQRESLKAEIAKEYENERTALKKSLEETQSELAKERQQVQTEVAKRELISYIDLAKSDYALLPVEPDKLGQLFYEIKKWDDTLNIEKSEDTEKVNHLEQLQTILKTSNDMLVKSGFFNEHGSTKSPTVSDNILAEAKALVEKGEASTVREALLKMDNSKQEAHIAKMDKQIARKSVN